MPDPKLSVYFPQLPIEVAEDIAKLSAHASSPHGLTYLSRVCKAFHNWVTPILYQSVFLSNAQNIALFAATIEETPRLRPLVIKLCILLAEYQAPRERSRRFTEDSNISESSDDGSTFPSDDNSGSEEHESMITEDLTLEAETVPEESAQGSTGFYSRFTPRVVPAPGYEFISTPAAPSTTWRLTGHRLSLAASLSRSVICDMSLVDAYSSIVLKHCIHIRTLLLLTTCTPDSDSLMFGGIADLTLHTAPFDLRDPIKSPTNDYSSLTHLALLDPHCRIPRHIPERAPNITHIQIRRSTCVATRDILTNMRHLTHLWFTPNYCTSPRSGALIVSPWVPFPDFLRDLHQKCLVLVRVRIDVGPQEDVGDIDNGLFPLVRVHRYAHVDPSWSSDTPWVSTPNVRNTTGNPDNSGGSDLNHNLQPDVEMDSNSDSDSDINLKKTRPMFNVYTARVKEYWMQHLHGGGWDD